MRKPSRFLLSPAILWLLLLDHSAASDCGDCEPATRALREDRLRFLAG
jgi:hypothetical protein